MTGAEDGLPLLEVRDLRVVTDGGAEVIADISLDLDAGEILGIAGESGCGKSTLGLAMLGYSRDGLRIADGSVRVAGRDLLALTESKRRAERGRLIAYVSQDASKALNPSFRVADLLHEVMKIHRMAGTEADIAQALQRVDLPSDKGFRRRFPHQLSGGQQQRLAIGIALACGPSVLVLDEPTTGLDVITQARILDEIARICREESVGAILVSHDLAAMASISSHIAVLYAGRIVEEHAASELIRRPRHPYTSGLIGSVPIPRRPERLQGISGIAVGVSERPPGCAFAPRCSQATDECSERIPDLREIGPDHRVRCIHWTRTAQASRVPRGAIDVATEQRLLLVSGLSATHGRGDREVVAADDVSFSIGPHECVALVGESGSGKTTIARCVAGLHAPAAGAIVLGDETLAPSARERSRELRRRLQIVFQNPYDSLNPSQTVEESIGRPLQMFFGRSARQAKQEVPRLLAQVRLPARVSTRYPRELSGGERQRVALARALAAEPDLLVCDEITSSLDVSVQAAVLDLLGELEVAMMFITHDLGVVASIADRVLVLEHGTIREEGPVGAVLSAPSDPYTARLIAAIPELPVDEGANTT